MTYRLRVSRRAARQIREASSGWLRNRDKAPSAFAEDLEDALRLVTGFPRVGEPVRHPDLVKVRRLLLARTRHHLDHLADEATQTVDLLALWHASRETPPLL